MAGRDRTLPLRTGSLAFTLCQVPVVYELAEEQQSDGTATVVHFADGSTIAVPDRCLGAELSDDLFARNGRISWIRVSVVGVGAVS